MVKFYRTDDKLIHELDTLQGEMCIRDSDETVDRVSGEKGFVKEYTLKELKRLNV